ncbi:hypothetical protein [Spirillospora albida]|uniref:hypothetical protein n=1 Tax=Spirillospora albida TaxID=58123 RepID=UPI000A05836F|nr:hypothetical protein [Spirillospora albida]
MNSPYDHEALWIKAKLFLNRAMDDDFRSFDEQALWAALALELLAKAALARVSPLLVAEPTEDGTNLLIASGLVSGEARFTSVRAKTLFARCHKAFKPFDQAEANRIINGRNEYLHSSGTGFMAIPPKVWWPRYWAQATILVTALDQDIAALVGADRERIVLGHLEQNAKNVELRTEALIERAKQRLQQRREGTLRTKVAAEWKVGRDLTAWLSHNTTALCPACGSEGVLEGEDVENTQIFHESGFYSSSGGINEDITDVTVELTIGSDYFSCPTCQLVLDSWELINHAGLPTSFETEGNPEDYFQEPEYGND